MPGPRALPQPGSGWSRMTDARTEKGPDLWTRGSNFKFSAFQKIPPHRGRAHTCNSFSAPSRVLTLLPFLHLLHWCGDVVSQLHFGPSSSSGALGVIYPCISGPPTVSSGTSSGAITVRGRGVFLSPPTVEGSLTRGSQSHWFGSVF